MKLLDYVKAVLAHSEWRLSKRKDPMVDGKVHIGSWEEDQWSDVHASSRRLSEYCDDVEGILLGLGYALLDPNNSIRIVPDDWSDCEKDFQYIRMRLLTLKARAEGLSNSMTAMAGIAGNKQALREAKRSVREAISVKLLTLVAMVFIPLTFTSALFSMSDKYQPGEERFGIYFAVSAPLVVLVFLFAGLVEFGYDDEGRWSTSRFRGRLLKMAKKVKRDRGAKAG